MRWLRRHGPGTSQRHTSYVEKSLGSVTAVTPALATVDSQDMGAHRERAGDLHALTSDPTESSDLVLDREDLEALHIFHRSFNLPGLRLGLINPVCADDYFPKEEQDVGTDDVSPAIDREPWIDDLPSQLAAALPQQTESLLQQAEALLNPTEEIDEDISDSPAAPAEPAYGSDSRPHSRTIRTRPVVRSAGRR